MFHAFMDLPSSAFVVEMSSQAKHRACALECHRARIAYSIAISLRVALFDASRIAFNDPVS